MVLKYGSARPNRRVQLLVATAITSGVVTVMTLPVAHAKPGLCQTTVDPKTKFAEVVCTGDHSSSIKSGTDFDAKTLETLILKDIPSDTFLEVNVDKNNNAQGPKVTIHHIGYVYGLLGDPKGVAIRSSGQGSGGARTMGVTAFSDVYGINGAISVTSVSQKGDNGSGDGSRGKDGHQGDRVYVTVMNRGEGVQTRVQGGQGNAIEIGNQAGAGGNGSSGTFYAGGTGGKGGTGNETRLELDKEIFVYSPYNASGFYLYSQGANGGKGGSASYAGAGRGGFGGSGGLVTIVGHDGVVPNVELTTGSNTYASGDGAPAVLMVSKAGDGGDGADSGLSSGGSGNGGGFGGDIVLDPVNWTLNTTLDKSPGIVAQSIGGKGGTGGTGAIWESSGKGGVSGDGGDITLKTRGAITTRGADSSGISAHTVAGRGGSGGMSGGLVSFAASGGSAGNGGVIDIDNSARIVTSGGSSTAIAAQSVGGGGGNGGSDFALFYSRGGDGSPGGAGGNVTIRNAGSLTTSGGDSFGIHAQSIGGTGGNGGGGGSLISSLGGRGKYASDGGAVFVDNSGAIATGAKTSTPVRASADPVCGDGCSSGIMAQSIGGGGGNGGISGGVIANVGGGSGGGGKGGAVEVRNTGNISTAQASSHAVAAQSVGGGGGNGGGAISISPGVAVAVGGKGSSGGDGGKSTVNVTNGAKLTTLGDESHGIFALSAGGGGGTGGYAVSVAANKAAAAFAIGGSGGGGGKGGAVEVNTVASNYSGPVDEIQTSGKGSAGILALSAGGGGGTGGFAVSAAASVQIGAVSFAMGGTGGSGGQGGDVRVMSDAHITTRGDDAPAIQAQSIGGGGGNGGFTIAGALNIGDSKSPAIALALGSSGGDGGRGASVYVRNYSGITTSGKGSPLILAQSVGGGGGNAGLTIAGSASITKETVAISTAVGGDGGKGGAGGSVEVVNTAGLIVTGPDSPAIMAQSIGGGGGNANTTVAGSLSAGKDAIALSLALGGNGGGGGDGGMVSVKNEKTITAGTYIPQADVNQSNANSFGIFAQSIGGGGGFGAFTGAFSGTLKAEGKPMAMAVALGGAGGSAGKGEQVTVNNSGAITTLSDISHAVFAQSVGGGGGAAGNSYGVAIQLQPEKKIPLLTLGFAIGGNGGKGNKGGAVVINNSGAILTRGIASHGLFGQSVGGSGGEGGNSDVMGYAFINTSDGKAAHEDSRNLSIAIGGTGGSGNHGDKVTINSSGAIHVDNSGSFAIYGQSVGGGGGGGGDAYALKGVKSDAVKRKNEVKVTVGGSGGAGGDGGDVVINHTRGDVLTEGAGSAAIVAQSVGGGGGVAGRGVYSVKSKVKNADAIQSKRDIAVGGIDGAAGKGGNVTVNFSGGSIVTTGNGEIADLGDPETGIDNSYGIFAQSVGGGGGLAGNATFFGLGATADLTKNNGLLIGVGRGVTANNKNSGDGGAVKVIANGDVTTRGANSIGIFAQSVGGGGGVSGDAGIHHKDDAYTLIGSAGGSGKGGDVSVALSGKLYTYGAGAHGIFAQSVGTTGSGNVSVSVDGQVVPKTYDTYAIYTQSYSSGGNTGNITIDIAKGAYIRSSETETPPTYGRVAPAIVIDGGKQNVITNAGTIESTKGQNGMIIDVRNGGQTTLINSGTLRGFWNLGDDGKQINQVSSVLSVAEAGGEEAAVASGPSQVVNLFGGVMDLGGASSVGAGGTVTNSGTINIAREALAEGPVSLTGNLLQTETGVLSVAVEAGKTYDAPLLSVSGTAEVHGEIDVDLANQTVGAGDVDIVAAGGGLDPASTARLSNGLNGPVSRFALLHRFGNKLSLNYDIDFARAEVLAGLPANQGAVAGALRQVYAGRTIDADFLPLLQVASLHDYSRLLERLTPVPYAMTQTVVARSSDRFNDSLLDCRIAGAGDVSIVGDGGCLRVGAQARRMQNNVSGQGYEVTTGQFSVSGEKAFGDGWAAGFGVSYERWTAEADRDIWSSKADQFQAGLSLKRQFGDTFVAASISGGHADVETKRNTLPYRQARGDQDVWFAGGQLRVGHTFGFGNWYVRPQTDLNLTYVSARAVHERNGLQTNLIVHGSNETFVSLQPAIEFGGWFDAGNGFRVSPHFSVGLTQYLTDPKGTVSSAFATAPGVSFKTTSEIDRTSFDFKAGVDLVSQESFSFGVNGFTRVGKDNVEYGGGVKLGLKF